LKIYTIIPNLLYQRGEFSHFPLNQSIQFLRELNIIAVVNVAPRADYALRDSNAVAYVHEPFPDGHRAERIFPAAERAARAAYEFLRWKQPVLVHCHAGRNRSSLVTAILLMELQLKTGSEAIAILRKIRPNALANQEFVLYLKNRITGLFRTPNFP
jgi:Predicted protein-tyrosine phosphatase